MHLRRCESTEYSSSTAWLQPPGLSIADPPGDLLIPLRLDPEADATVNPGSIEAEGGVNPLAS